MCIIKVSAREEKQRKYQKNIKNKKERKNTMFLNFTNDQGHESTQGTYKNMHEKIY